MRRRPARCAALLLAVLAPGGGAFADPGLERRIARLSCGNTVVTAQTECHAGTELCVREALTFRRVDGSTTVAPHKQLVQHALPGGARVDALNYRVARWSCLEGANGGRYIAIVLARTGGGECRECEYTRLHHPNGRLIAATLRFDADERPRANEAAAALIGKLTVKPPPGAFRPVYDN